MTAVQFEYPRVSAHVVGKLREIFGANTIVVASEGYLGRVHLKVISEKFNGMGEREKQNYVWDIIHAELDQEAQQAISVVICYSTDEL